MNSEQIMILLRDVLKVGGGIAIALGATDAQVAQWTQIALLAGGALASIGGVVWSQARNTDAATVGKAVALPDVKGITVTKPELATAARQADPVAKVDLKPQF